MNASFARIFTVEVDDRPTVSFEARNTSEANSILKEAWFRDDLRELRSHGRPLWDGSAVIRARAASEEETGTYQGMAAEAAEADGDLILAFLISLDSAV